MARGFPDYFGLSIFLKYGTLTKKTAAKSNLSSSLFTEIMKISAKGRTYCGYFLFNGAPASSSLTIRLVIDGVTLDRFNINLESKKTTASPFTSIFFLTDYDDVDQQYIVNLQKDITFEQTLLIEAIGSSGNTTDCDARIYYAKVI